MKNQNRDSKAATLKVTRFVAFFVALTMLIGVSAYIFDAAAAADGYGLAQSETEQTVSAPQPDNTAPPPIAEEADAPSAENENPGIAEDSAQAEEPGYTEDNTDSGNLPPPPPAQNIDIRFAEDGSDFDALFITRNENYNLLEGASAADEGEISISIFIVDDGGFDIEAEFPYNEFTVTYGARHPVSDELFTRERTVFVVEGIEALFTDYVNTWEGLRTAVNNGATEIVLTQSILTGGPVINIPATADITLTSETGELFTLWQTASARHFAVNGTLRLENITLSGHYPSNTANHGGILVNAGGSLYMEEDSAIRNNRNSGGSQGGGVTVSGANATLTMTDGEISDNSGGTGAGGVFVGNGALFTMDGGELSGNSITGNTGGGIYVANPGSRFVMNDGVLRNNAGRFGGGVRVGASGSGTPTLTTAPSMRMEGGEIYDNTALFGGGVNVEWGIFTMIDGTIRNNTVTAFGNPPSSAIQANRGGGGVFVQNSGRFYMQNGTIRNNDSGNHGGGVMLLPDTTFTMTGGRISRNTTVNNGGGVITTGANTTFTMSGGTIGGLINNEPAGNTATLAGGGVAITTGGTFTMSGATTISENRANGTGTSATAAVGGGGVFVTGNNSVFNMSSGELVRNTADRGGGVSILSGGRFNLSGTGLISNNLADGNIPDGTSTATGGGGGVFAAGNAALLYMTGGRISANRSSPSPGIGGGAGVHVTTGAAVDMSGGIIGGDSLSDANSFVIGNGIGAGVMVNSAAFLMRGDARIAFNSVPAPFPPANNNTSNGGGVTMHGTTSGANIATFTMRENAIIEYNDAGTGAGGVNAAGGILNLEDGTIARNRINPAGTGGSGIVVSGTAIVNMSGGAIEWHTANRTSATRTTTGGGVRMNGGTFNMTGGYIRDNFVRTNGGGVFVAGGTFNFDDGTIERNTARTDAASLGGGGVFVQSGNFTMGRNNTPGGTMQYNDALRGGGIYMSGGTVRMYDGLITSNIVSTDAGHGGGGVRMSGGNFHMDGGTITNHGNDTPVLDGGGVLMGGGTFHMSGGTINDNEAENTGGGVRMTSGTFNMTGGVISGNAAANGGGMYLEAAASLNASGSSFSNNTADSMGGAIFTETYSYRNPLPAGAYGNLSITDVSFSGNSASFAAEPPVNANITGFSFDSVSAYDHPLNNYDINYDVVIPFVFYKVDDIFDYLEDAVFHLYRWDDEEDAWERVDTATSPQSGRVEFLLTPDGTYRLVEYQAPDGFLTPEDHWDLLIDAATATVTPVPYGNNPWFLNSLTSDYLYLMNMPAISFGFIKTDEELYDTPHVINPLAGATFRLYRMDWNTTEWIYLDTAVSAGPGGENPVGWVEFQLATGNVYRLVETEAPDGFETPTGYWTLHFIQIMQGVEAHGAPITIVAHGGNPPFMFLDNQWHVGNFPEADTVPFTFHKTDERVYNYQNWDAIDTFLLSGATFVLYRWDGDGPAPEMVLQNAIGPGGWVLAGTATSTNDPTQPMEFEMMPGETYHLVETVAPPGFELPMGQWRIIADEDGETFSITAMGDTTTPAFVFIPENEMFYVGNRPRLILPLLGGVSINTLLMIGGFLFLLLAMGTAVYRTAKGKQTISDDCKRNCASCKHGLRKGQQISCRHHGTVSPEAVCTKYAYAPRRLAPKRQPDGGRILEA
ncbi:MAG: SpaA isopeptide-forming pilin-related protein [Oscillospiraceae bacterium]|nr:SpaA isopeptide-forming pilin-related protein [Oscillospiraceae bacterium]